MKYGSSRLAVDFRDQYGDDQDLGWLPTGVSPVQYVLQWGLFDVPNMLAVHCTQVDENDIEVLASHDVAIAYCPRCNAKLGMGMAPLGSFLRHDIRVGHRHRLTRIEQHAWTCSMRCGSGCCSSALCRDTSSSTSPAQFVKLATLDAARALGIDDRSARWSRASKADIIAVDISHSHQIPTQYPYSTLVHTANQENVLFTMVDGKVLYDQGTWTTLDSERILGRADEMRDEASRLMLERGTVVAADQGRADIMIMPTEKCDDCEICSEGAGGRRVLEGAIDPLGVAPGDVVELETPLRARRRAQLLVFVFPVVALVVGYLAGYLLSSVVDMDPDTLGAVTRCDRGDCLALLALRGVRVQGSGRNG